MKLLPEDEPNDYRSVYTGTSAIGPIRRIGLNSVKLERKIKTEPFNTPPRVRRGDLVAMKSTGRYTPKAKKARMGGYV